MRKRLDRVPRVHLLDRKIYLGTGDNIPICKSESRVLDLRKTKFKLTLIPDKVTCLTCIKILEKMAKVRGFR